MNIDPYLSSHRLLRLRSTIEALRCAVTRSQHGEAGHKFYEAAKRLSPGDIWKLIVFIQYGSDEEDRRTSFLRGRLMLAMAIGKPTQDVIASLTNLLGCHSTLSRIFAMDAIAIIGPRASEAVEPLMDVIGEYSGSLAYFACSAVRSIVPEDSTIEKQLRDLEKLECRFTGCPWDRVYTAERWVLRSNIVQKFRTIADVGGWLDTVVNTKWFRERFPLVQSVYLADGRGSKVGRGVKAEHGHCILTLPRFARCKRIVLHELAHTVSPQKSGHNAVFCGNYLSLVNRFIGRAAWGDLKLNFETFRVPHRPSRGKHAGVPRKVYVGEFRRPKPTCVAWRGGHAVRSS